MDQASVFRRARRALLREAPLPPPRKGEEEGGCGVVGLASTVPLAGRYLLPSLCQMRNRGNGKGGGVAIVGLSARELGVAEDVLRGDTLLQIAYLDPAARADVEARHVFSCFEVDHARPFPVVRDPAALGLSAPPPEVWAYFVRLKPAVLQEFVRECAGDGRRGPAAADPDALRDEFVYQNSFRLNRRYYASLGEKKAFVLSHGRDLLVFKLVGYAEDVLAAYGLGEMTAHVWIGHHRYPTKGRVWHPGGAHPFVGLHEALVHNGDFANYYSITRYLEQHGLAPLFLTDTEVSVLLFDLLRRAYGYPLEHVFESLAPTTERDFEMLPAAKQAVYRRLRQIHIHGSPDGPWFFIVAANPPVPAGAAPRYELIGITDTSMLRPQVFALQRGELDIGLIASEKQAIDAVLRGLHAEGRTHAPYADHYWNARGGSFTDGGAFVFTVERNGKPGGDGHGNGNGAAATAHLVCTNKFGAVVDVPPVRAASRAAELAASVETLVVAAQGPAGPAGAAIDELTRVLDGRGAALGMKRSAVQALAEGALERIFLGLPRLDDATAAAPPPPLALVDWAGRAALRTADPRGRLVVDARGFPAEGDESLARFLVEAWQRGFRSVACFGLRGHRFLASGLGAATKGFVLDLFGSSGDYLASGLDGGTVVVHGSGQDQLGNILKAGRLVVHGDVGQCFLYGAKGGEVYVLGNAAGRPLISAVGAPRVVLNGTALDYLAESFMAGDPLAGGGFVVVNGVEFDADGVLRPQATPYPGGNLFSLASGGAVYVRDPEGKLTEDQLNGGAFARLTDADWRLILPYLEENERLFGIRVQELLTAGGRVCAPAEVYRAVTVRRGQRH